MLRRDLGRRLVATSVLLGAQAFADGSAPPAGPASRGLRVDYSAPAGCPGSEMFLALVRGRIGTAWEAAEGVPAAPLVVRVTSEGERSVARLELEDDRGSRIARTVAADTCEEVVSGIALVTALAIESRVSPHQGVGASGAVPPPAGAPPISAAPVAPGSAAAPRVPTAAPPEPRAEPSGPLLHVDFGASVIAATGAGPTLGWGPRAFTGIGWEAGPDFRVAVEQLRDDGRRNTRFVLTAAELSGCPWALPLAPAMRFLPCAGVAAGEFRGIGDGAAGETAYSPGEDAVLWAAAVAALRLDATYGPLFVELGVDARFSTRSGRVFVIDPAPSSQEEQDQIYAIPLLAFGFSAGLGLRL